jgi:hypothetical protein
MALTSENYTRPAATSTNNEAVQLTLVGLEDTAATPDNVTIDLKATVNAAARLVHRLRVTPEISGTNQRLKVEFLDFSSSGDQTYANAKNTPFTDAEADSVTMVGYSPWVNLDALYTLAGDARS